MPASRRELLKLGLVTGASLAIPGAALAQTPDEIAKDLGHPLSEEARKLLGPALQNNRNNAKERLKTKLPDCSEPCFVYRPTGGRK